jgi:uncharacterized membrane protein
MTLPLTLAAFVILNWISAETAAKMYLVVIIASYLALFVEVLRGEK